MTSDGEIDKDSVLCSAIATVMEVRSDSGRGSGTCSRGRLISLDLTKLDTSRDAMNSACTTALKL